MYTKEMFGNELKKLIFKKTNVKDIGRWAFTTYWDNIENFESGLRKIALDLNIMEDNPQFELPYRILNKIADDLIAGKDVDLNAKEYREG
jgi:hypothetical protein